MGDQPPYRDLDQKFRQLQELLFEEDGQLTDRIRIELDNLRTEIRSRKEIDARVQPYFDEKLRFLQENFPELFGAAMAQTIKNQIRDSQDEMIDALYPIIGKLIRKFIAKEFERLTESLDRSINDAFSWQGWWRRIKGWFRGESDVDRIVQDLARAEVQEVFIVDKESGLLAGAWARQERLDQDMVAGMLTAIKSFVETAFEAGEQELETIEYDNYKIVLHNFHTFYFAVVLTGIVSSEYRDRLFDYLMAFEEKHKIVTRTDLDEDLIDRNSLLLKTSFDEFDRKNQ